MLELCKAQTPPNGQRRWNNNWIKNKDMVCKLLKALYGLKQSPRLWYETLSTSLLEKQDLTRIHADHGIFITKAGLNGPIVSTFVDDIKIMGVNGIGFITKVKAELAAAFSMVDIGPISFYLGLKVNRDRGRRQSNYRNQHISIKSLRNSA